MFVVPVTPTGAVVDKRMSSVFSTIVSECNHNLSPIRIKKNIYTVPARNIGANVDVVRSVLNFRNLFGTFNRPFQNVSICHWNIAEIRHYRTISLVTSHHLKVIFNQRITHGFASHSDRALCTINNVNTIGMYHLSDVLFNSD